MALTLSDIWVEYAEVISYVSKAAVDQGLSRNRKGLTTKWKSKPNENDRRKKLILFSSIPESSQSKMPGKDYFINKIIQQQQIQEAEQIEQQKNERKLSLHCALAYALNNNFHDHFSLYKSLMSKERALEHAQLHAVLNKVITLFSRNKNGYNLKEIFEVYQELKVPVFKPTHYVSFSRKISECRKAMNELKDSKEGIKKTILHDLTGKQNAKKLKEEQKLILRQIYARPNNFNFKQVTEIHNQAVEFRNQNTPDPEEHWKTLCLSTVKNYLNTPEAQKQCTAMRNGIAEHRNDFDNVIKRARPSKPNLLWEEDGWNFELYYQRETTNKNNQRQVNYFHRKVVSFIMDAYCEYIPGYSIADQENIEMKAAAWKNAVINTGVFPSEIKTDHFGLKTLEGFYAKLAVHTRTSEVGNARDKSIEGMFARFNESILKFYPNWSGSNITAKRQASHPNREYLNEIRHSFPNEEGVIRQIDEAIYRWNNLPLEKYNGKSRKQIWLEGDHSQDRLLTPKARLEVFGIEHNYKNELTNKGLLPTINGRTLQYNLWEDSFNDLIGSKFQITYDPDDLSLILATNAKGQSYLVPMEIPEKMAFADMGPGDRERLNKKLAFKQRQHQRIQDANNRDMEAIMADSNLKQVFLGLNSNKHMLQAAENKKKELSEPDYYDMIEIPEQKPQNNEPIMDRYDYE